MSLEVSYDGAAPSAPWQNGLAFEFISIIAYTAGVARVNGPHDQTENRGKRVKARLPLRTILSSCHSFLHFPNLIGQLVPSVLISFLRGWNSPEPGDTYKCSESPYLWVYFCHSNRLQLYGTGFDFFFASSLIGHSVYGVLTPWYPVIYCPLLRTIKFVRMSAPLVQSILWKTF